MAEKVKEDSSQSSSSLRTIDGNYKVDIARNKGMLLYNEVETLNKQADVIGKLTAEIDRTVTILSSEGLPSAERKAYEEYQKELRIELEKWNTLTRFGGLESPQAGPSLLEGTGHKDSHNGGIIIDNGDDDNDGDDDDNVRRAHSMEVEENTMVPHIQSPKTGGRKVATATKKSKEVRSIASVVAPENLPEVRIPVWIEDFVPGVYFVK